MHIQSLSQKDSLEEEMATCSGVLAWKIPWTEEPSGLSPWGHKLDPPHTHKYIKKMLLLYVIQNF